MDGLRCYIFAYNCGCLHFSVCQLIDYFMNWSSFEFAVLFTPASILKYKDPRQVLDHVALHS